jgi:hypothetical protein
MSVFKKKESENEKLLKNIEELDRQKLPKWFTGECYTHGEQVTNRFGGDSCYLNNVELSMYDFIMGATQMYEMGIFNSAQHGEDLRKGLDWFRKNNPSAYMTLLD